MLRYLFICLLLAGVSLTECLAQNDLKSKYELGFAFSAFNYKGDMNDGYANYTHTRPGGAIFGRYNFKNNYYASMKGVISFGSLYSRDADSKDPLKQQRGIIMKATILDVSLLFEYNFLNFREPGERYGYTPYLCGGLGVHKLFHTNSGDIGQPLFNSLNLNMPLGIGFKVKLGNKVDLAAEILAKKTFYDDFEGVNADMTDKYLYFNPVDNDIFYTASITFSYRIEAIVCPKK